MKGWLRDDAEDRAEFSQPREDGMGPIPCAAFPSPTSRKGVHPLHFDRLSHGDEPYAF
jgi:hypothetical protein